ncbi:GPI transamidase component PIG-S like [Actinidia chinensis var. chinensis]|uniref:GPI transamidase component PIG-S like n=1 Tax=Actinidia chinensis var. chinensis TaxID=1590841 RepID=A0A2R6PPB3_ACTCC|nr:GPI transamidase component PIG-S like [Actinidia chinensis var. chinensis]
MAEISEAPEASKDDDSSTVKNISDTAPQVSRPLLDFDPNTMRKTKPGLKRLILSLSVLFSFLLGLSLSLSLYIYILYIRSHTDMYVQELGVCVGLPLLLKSIEIYRAPLPFREIDSLSNAIESSPLVFPCHFQAIFVGFDQNEWNEAKLRVSILGHMKKFMGEDLVCGTCGNNYTVSVIVYFGNDLNLDDKLKDYDVDEHLESVLGSGEINGGKTYTVVVVKRDQEVKAVVGKRRHGWIVGRVSEVDVVEKIAEIFVKVFVNGGKEEGLIPGEFMPVGADGKVVLSFNLLNADPNDWIYDWDFQKIDEILLAPIIKALEPVANISVESQVNSNEWHLDTSIAAGGRSKVLQVVVYILLLIISSCSLHIRLFYSLGYVPSAKECPLLLQLPNGEISMTNGFISPMWGGVIVWNPPGCSRDSENMHPLEHKISHQDLEKIFEVFMGQLRQLFGLKSNNLYVGTSGTFVLLASERGFTEWELDVLSRQHTCFNLLSCTTTLGSLSRLVQSLPRMIIMDEIGKQVKFSLEAANLAQSNASLGIYDASAVSSRQARSLAEDAFFHPSIMSVSYYSFEHCFAVYSPFFLPVSLHVILAAVREWRRFKQESSNRQFTFITTGCLSISSFWWSCNATRRLSKISITSEKQDLPTAAN